MKFEKFLKSVGTHGEIVKRSDSEKWLVCGGVGMVIPRGVENLLGVPRDERYASVVDVLANAELDDPVELKESYLLDPAGNAKSIVRVFETGLGDRVGIMNDDYGLLERHDALGYGEIEVPATDDNDALTVKYVLVYDRTGKNIQGFITGAQTIA